MAEQDEGRPLNIDSFIGNEVTVSYEMPGTVAEVTGEIVGSTPGGIIIQYESRKKIHTEMIPYATIKGMDMSEPVAEEENPDGEAPEAPEAEGEAVAE
jgi:hypothetical protein